MSKSVELTMNGPVAELRLHKPPVNALDESALHALTEAVDQVEDDAAIRVVVISSALKDIFCVGGDLKYWPRLHANQPDLVSETGRRVFSRIERLSKPSIAAIQGHVIGDGLSLALACDIRLCSQQATFHLPEVGYGFIPGWGTVGRLVATVGTGPATELLLGGDRIGGVRAHAIGLVSRVTSSDDLMPAAEALAARLAAKPPKALRYAKAALRGDPATNTADQTAWEARCFAAVWGGDEWKQGLHKLFSATTELEPEESHERPANYRQML